MAPHVGIGIGVGMRRRVVAPGPPPPPTLNALSLSSATIAENSAAGTLVGALLGTTSGSTLALVDTAGSRFALSGSNIVAGSVSTDFETATSHSITVRETLAGATNTPRDTVLSINVTDVSESAPVNQSVQFGRRTFAGAGAAQLVGTFSGATIATDDGTTPGHWQITGGGAITPTAAYVTGPQAASYSLVINPGGGNPNITVSITTEADVYDWATQADWNQLAALSSVTLFGRTIKARPGISGVIASGVDGTAARFRRADFGGCVITSRDMNSRPVFDRFVFSGTRNLTLEGIDTPETTTQKVTLISSATWPITNITIRNNRLTGQPFDPATWDWAGTLPPNQDIIATNGAPDTISGLVIEVNEVRWGRNCINVAQGGGATPLRVAGNFVSDFAGGDGIKINYGTTALRADVEDNVVVRPLSRGTDLNNPHCDGIQFAGAGTATTDFNIRCNRNIVLQAGARGSAQGIFADDQGTGGNFHFVGEARGNVVEMDSTHALSVLRARDFIAEGNTVKSHITTGSAAGGIKIGAGSGSATTAGTHILTRNVSDSYTIGGTPTMTDNVTMGAGGSIIPYTDVFDGAGLGACLTRAEVLSRLARKANGPADLPSGLDAGAVGSGFVNWPSTSPGGGGSFN